jgi:hypothetical protein
MLFPGSQTGASSGAPSGGAESVIVSTIPDGYLRTQPIYVRTAYGIDRRDAAGIPQPIDEDADVAEPNVAVKLRKTSGLSVGELARLTGVSRTRFHKWLLGEGLSGSNRTHVERVLATIEEIKSIVGDTLAAFLRAPGPAGVPLELLREGNTDAALGAAILPRPLAGAPVRHGFDGMLFGVPRPLGWTAPKSLDWEMMDELERLAPRATGQESAMEPDEHGADFNPNTAAALLVG